MHLILLQRLLNHSLHIAAVNLARIQKLEALLARENKEQKNKFKRKYVKKKILPLETTYLNDRVSDADHVFGQILDEGEETPFGVEPGVGPQLLVVRLQGLDDTRNPELVVALGAVQSACNHSTVGNIVILTKKNTVEFNRICGPYLSKFQIIIY